MSVWVLRLRAMAPTSHNDGRVLVCILDAWPELRHMLEIYNATVSHASVNLNRNRLLLDTTPDLRISGFLWHPQAEDTANYFATNHP